MTGQLTRVILRLGRNPGFPEGDEKYGYTIMAPLDADGWLEPTLWKANKEACTVRRFHPKDAAADGWLRHRGENWYFWYDEAEEGPEEPVFKLGTHRLVPGEYVTIRESDGDVLTFRVSEANRV